jgi:grpE
MSENNESQENKETMTQEEPEKEGTIDFAKLNKAQLKEIAEELVKENETLQFANDALTAKYQKAEKIAAQANDISTLYQRLQVDFDNYRKRNADIVEKSKDDAEAMIVAKVLPVYDNMLRAMQNVKDGNDLGLTQIAKQFESILKELNVERIPALGEPFNLEYHDAILSVKAESKEEDEIIKNVISEGYFYKGKVLKHAQVIVAKFEEA